MHWQHIKALINTCQVQIELRVFKNKFYWFFQSLIVSDACSTEGVSSATAALMNQAPPAHFCSMVVRLVAAQILNTQVILNNLYRMGIVELIRRICVLWNKSAEEARFFRRRIKRKT